MSKKEHSKPETFITVVGFVLLFFVVLIIGSYICKFGAYNFSDAPDKWGVFGDYMGGTLNTLFGLANLVVLTYITLKITRIEERRNNESFIKGIKPILIEEITQEPHSLQLSFESCGLGPALIDEFEIKTRDGKVFNSFFEIAKELKLFNLLYFQITDVQNKALPPGKELLSFKVNKITDKSIDLKESENAYNRLLHYLSDVEVRITFTNALKSEFYKVEYKLPIII